MIKRPITNETWSPIKCALAFKEYADYLEQQLEKERLELNTDDPYNYVLTNQIGDTFTFNPQKGIGEELNDFLYGYFNPKPKR